MDGIADEIADEISLAKSDLTYHVDIAYQMAQQSIETIKRCKDQSAELQACISESEKLLRESRTLLEKWPVK
jgi:chemotaxis regulatin CheY-phosphate phosphatase CheZ